MKALIITFALFASFTSFAREKVVPRIEISGLSGHGDDNISVFYSSGEPAGFGTSGHILHTQKIWKKVGGLKINSSGAVDIPSVKVVNTRGVAFNYIVFVIHKGDQKDVRLLNTDGTCPAQPDNGESFSSKKQHCAAFSADEFKYKKQRYKSVRKLKPDSDGIVRLKL